MIYLLIFTVAGFIVIMAWCWWLQVKINNNYNTLADWYADVDTRMDIFVLGHEDEQTLSELLSKWDEAYANSDKYQRRIMTINRQKHGIHTAAKLHGVCHD